MVSVGDKCVDAAERAVVVCAQRQPQFNHAATCGEGGIERNVARERKPCARADSRNMPCAWRGLLGARFCRYAARRGGPLLPCLPARLERAAWCWVLRYAAARGP